MNIYFIVDWYLRRLEDSKFVNVWQTYFVGRRPIFWSFVFYLVVLFTLTSSVNNSAGFLLGFLFFFAFAFVFGLFMIYQYIKFMSRNAMRYMNIMADGKDELFSKDNVVN